MAAWLVSGVWAAVVRAIFRWARSPLVSRRAPRSRVGQTSRVPGAAVRAKLRARASPQAPKPRRPARTPETKFRPLNAGARGREGTVLRAGSARRQACLVGAARVLQLPFQMPKIVSTLLGGAECFWLRAGPAEIVKTRVNSSGSGRPRLLLFSRAQTLRSGRRLQGLGREFSAEKLFLGQKFRVLRGRRGPDSEVFWTGSFNSLVSQWKNLDPGAIFTRGQGLRLAPRSALRSPWLFSENTR